MATDLIKLAFFIALLVGLFWMARGWRRKLDFTPPDDLRRADEEASGGSPKDPADAISEAFDETGGRP